MSSHAMEQQMQALEEALLHQDFRQHSAALEALLAEDFEEVSPQGQRSSRAAVMQWLLRKPPEHRWQLRDWQVTELSPTVRLVRYHASQVVPLSQSRGALHCSLWSLDATTQQWRLRFHQSSKLA